MASALTKPIKRTIRVYGIDYPVIALFTENGVEMCLPGFKTRCFCSWEAVVTKAMSTPYNAPSIVEGNAHKFLRDQALKLAKKEAAKQSKK
jgi:hypothetical protein